MKKFYAAALAGLLALFSVAAPAQEANKNSIRFSVKNEETGAAVGGAKVSLRETNVSAVTDAAGSAVLGDIPDGEQVFEIFADGFEAQEVRFTFPLADNSEKPVLLKVNEVGEVVISTTRTGREIED